MAAFDFAKVKDPTFFKENVLNAHASFRTYASREEYRTGSSSLALKLDGIWKFAYAKNYTSAIPGFEKTDYDCSGWDDIHVPAHIQMEGYDIPQYANVQYPWDGREEVQPGEIPQRFNPVASYVKYFELPGSMEGKPVHIEFEGVESGMALWLNGSYVGYTEDSFSAHAFDLTPYLQPGMNKLAVQVFKWTSSSWCEDQDFFRFSGIFRSVWLYAIPTVHLEDVSVKTLFAGDDFAHSTLEVALQVEGKGAARLTLRRSELEVFSEKIPLSGGSALFSHAVENPHLWSAEDPALYELEIELLDDAGHPVEVTGQKVGFRKFELKNNRMLLNGKRIVFKGANRHEFSSITGRAVGVHTHEELLRDIITMKQNNINAIRTSHYQNQDALYDLCDEYGLYLIAENNLESHGTWDIHQAGIRGIEGVLPNDKPEWKAVLFDRMNSTYQRDKNHPAVLIWSLGNESFGGETLLQMAEMVRRFDDTRLVHYEGVVNDPRFLETTDIESHMYSTVKDIKEYLAQGDKRPYIECEYSHAMGNSNGALHKYTELADQKDCGYQGGFIWDYIDQSIWKKDRYGKWFQAYGGDFGERPTDYNFSGNGIAYGGDRAPSPKMQEVKFCYQNIAVSIGNSGFEVWNKNLFTSTGAFDCVALLHRDGKLYQQQELTNIDVAPEERSSFPLPFMVPALPGEYAVTISFRLKADTSWAKKGHEVAFGQGVIAVVRSIPSKKVTPFTVTHGTHNIGVRGENFDVLFSDLNGGLTSYRYAGKEMIQEIPRPNFWRAPTDNDQYIKADWIRAQYDRAQARAYEVGVLVDEDDVIAKPESIELRADDEDAPVASFGDDAILDDGNVDAGDVSAMATSEDGSVVVDGQVTIHATMALVAPIVQRIADIDADWTIAPDGSVALRMHVMRDTDFPFLPRFGLRLFVPKPMRQIAYCGLGPNESYIDKRRSSYHGVFSGTPESLFEPYIKPQENGNHHDCDWASVASDDAELLVLRAGDHAFDFQALPYTQEELTAKAHNSELKPADSTVVCVDYMQSGVGSNSCGPKLHEKSRLDDAEFDFDLVLRPQAL